MKTLTKLLWKKKEKIFNHNISHSDRKFAVHHPSPRISSPVGGAWANYLTHTCTNKGCKHTTYRKDQRKMCYCLVFCLRFFALKIINLQQNATVLSLNQLHVLIHLTTWYFSQRKPEWSGALCSLCQKIFNFDEYLKSVQDWTLLLRHILFLYHSWNWIISSRNE